MINILFLITLCISIFSFNQANENQMPESLKNDILNGEVQKVIDHLNQNPNDIDLKTIIDEYKYTALMLAIKSDSLPMFNEVLSKTQNINDAIIYKTTTLMFLSSAKISEENQLIFAELLLQNGVLINAQSLLKLTALMLAICCKKFKLARFLIDSGANINLVTENNETVFFEILKAIDNAANEDQKKEAIDIAKHLIQEGINLNHTTCLGSTPLIKSIEYLNVDLIIFLLNNGAKIDFIAKDANHRDYYLTALNASLQLRNCYHDDSNKKNILYNIIQLLIDKKANLSYQETDSGNFILSPLSYAIKYYDFEIIRLLVESKANIQIKDPANKNAIDYAREFYEEENDSKIKQIRKRILKYVEDPLSYTINRDRAIFVSTFFNYDRQDVANIITDYISEPEKNNDIDQLKEYLRNCDIGNIKSILKKSPIVLISKDEIGDTPLNLMTKYYYYDKYINKVDESILAKELSIITIILQNLLSLNNKENNYLEEQLRTAKLLATELKLPDVHNVLKQYEKLGLKI